VAGGLVGLLDDVAALAKLAAASIDDVGAAAGRASAKAAGVVVDDTAVTPAYVHGLAADRELPIIKRIAKGSLRNKLVFILPAALILSEFVPILVEIILMFGGAFLCYEGAHKIHHQLAHRGDRPVGRPGVGDGHDPTEGHRATDARGHELAVPSVAIGSEQEERTVTSAIRTDFILSAEIMVIALKEVIDEGFVARAAILVVVAILITVAVYGVVALIVKMDDIGLRMVEAGGDTSRKVGRALVAGMPKLLAVLSVVGTAAMVWVGGHILLVGTHELGWDGLADLVHDIEHEVARVAGIGGVLGWLANTAISAVIGLVVGFALVAIVARLPFGRAADHGTGTATAH
jgi:predicted DNA repair protein MutK